jgi:hypothetical protein
MKLNLPAVSTLASVLCAIMGDGGHTYAADIAVQPGNATISTAAANANVGDTLVLSEGEYHDAVNLPAGVALRGLNADKTILIATGSAAISTQGSECRIEGIGVRGAETTIRGVNASEPVYVARCRFSGIKEAVALRGAPLSDVVYCEFIDCGIGVRAIGRASPTVWGCLFTGGTTGVFNMEGNAYVRNNVFINVDVGVRLVTDEQPIIRNNVFMDCRKAALESKARKSIVLGPSIRNNLLIGAGSVIVALREGASQISHCAVHDVTAPVIRTEAGDPIVVDASIIEQDPQVSISPEGVVAIGNEAVLKGKGIRLNTEAKGTKATIGLSPGLTRVGCTPAEGVEVPGPRFATKPFVANAVQEEYVWMGMNQMQLKSQGAFMQNGKHIDTLTVQRQGQESTVEFDTDRFFGEPGLTP